MIDISIITINYNTSNLTKKFVQSVNKYTPSSITYEIIIVDNCSKNGDFQNLKNILKGFELKIVKSNRNLGFGGGNMFGTEYASGEYLAFINNDVLFIEDSFSPLINFMKTKDQEHIP